MKGLPVEDIPLDELVLLPGVVVEYLVNGLLEHFVVYEVVPTEVGEQLVDCRFCLFLFVFGVGCLGSDEVAISFFHVFGLFFLSDEYLLVYGLQFAFSDENQFVKDISLPENQTFRWEAMFL